MTYNPFGGTVYNLKSSVGSTSTTLTLSSFLEPVSDTPYTMALLNTDIAYGTIAPKTTSSEFISFTGITQNPDGTATLTGVTRGLAKKYPFTSDAAFKLPHSGQSQFVISNSPQLYKKFGTLDNDEVITGHWEAPDPLTAQGLVTRDWILALINGGPINVEAVIVQGTAGETVAAGNLVYLDTATGYWKKTDADTAATVNNVIKGIAQGAGTLGNPIANGVLLYGIDANQSGMTPGSIMYASNTAGGISSTPGTTASVIGVAITATDLYFDPDFYYVPTQNEKNAMVGTLGVPSSTNKYVTSDNKSAGLTDQSQLTQDASIAVGEANATTKKFKIAQSFIPSKAKIRGVNIYKVADTGNFTGTVTVSIQADTAGSPSGTALATVTLSNREWNGLAIGANEAVFAGEYTTTPGSTYWIVIESSTGDNSNHPNLGTNSAGGYASGSVKYNNTADGWVAVATVDLYFATIEGTASQVVETNSAGKIESTFFSTSELPLPAFFQEVPTYAPNTGTDATQILGFTSNQDGSIVYVAAYSGASYAITMYIRDSITGMYTRTNSVTTSNWSSATSQIGLTLLGSYLYLIFDAGANMGSYRYDAADLANEAGMTFGTPIATGGAAEKMLAWNDGTYLYFNRPTSSTTVYKESVSGTAYTQVSTSTATAGVSAIKTCSFFDGRFPYVVSYDGSGNFQVRKLTSVDGSAASVTSHNVDAYAAFDSTMSMCLAMSIDLTRMYIGKFVTISGAAVEALVMYMVPVTKS